MAEQSIPANRPEIYARCADLLIEKWDSSRGIDLAPNLRPFLRRVVQRLAWKMFTDAKGRQALPRAELAEFLATDVLADRYDSVDEARHASESFLDFCAGRAWVLTDTGSGTFEPWYGFTHKTFLEYFAANHLVKQEQSVAGVWSSIRPMLGDSRWDVVSELAVQIVDRDREDGADHLLGMLVDECEDGGVAVDVPRYLEFGARCLSACVPSTSALRPLVAASVRLALSQHIEARMNIRSSALIDAAFTGLLDITLPRNVTRVARAVADVLTAELKGSESAPDAALLWCAVDYWQDHPVGVELVEKRQALRSELIERWVRISHGWPTSGDVDLVGPPAVFGAYRVGDTAPGFAVLTMVREALARGVRYARSVEKKLEDLYPSLAALGIPQADLRQYRIGDAWTGEVDWSLFSKYSPVAKASLILLIVGALRANYTLVTGNVDDVALRNLLLAHEEAYREVDAVATLNSWHLPAEAQQQMVQWLVVAKSDRRR